MNFLPALLIAVALFGLSSCINKNDSFGAGFIPDDQRPRAKVYTITDIPLYTAAIDSVQTTATYLYSSVFGNINVPPFGNTAADLVFRVYPYVGSHNFGENPVFSSASLTLVISGHGVPDESQENIVQNIRLYPLNRTLHYDSLYYSNSIGAADYDPIQINVPGLTYNGEDTLIIPLTKEFGDFLLSGTETDMDSLAHFYEKYKGFVLKTDPLPTGNAGGRINSTDITNASLTLQYNNGTVDTTMIYYGDYGKVFSVFNHSSASLADYVAPLPAPEQTIYFEAMGGVKPVVDLTAITDSIRAMLANKSLRPEQLLINKAELIVSVAPGSDLDKCPTVLNLCYRDTSSQGKLVFPFIDDSAYSNFGGTINRSLRNYSFNISTYLQGLLKSETPAEKHTKLYLFPSATVEDGYGYSYTIINNLIYSYAQFMGNGSASPVKLKLTYTVLY